MLLALIYSVGSICISYTLDQTPCKVIHFVLDGLGDEAGKPAALLSEGFIAIAHFDAFIALCGTHALKREAAFLGFVPARGMLYDFGIDEHADVTAVKHSEDADALANHIRRKADAVVGMRRKRVRKVAGDGEVVLRRRAGRTLKKDGVVENGLLHDVTCCLSKSFVNKIISECAVTCHDRIVFVQRDDLVQFREFLQVALDVAANILT